MSSWFQWGTPKGKRELSPNSRKDAFQAVYIDENGPDIGTRQGQADFMRYANAKNDPASAGYIRDQERCTSENRDAMGALRGEGIKYRDFAIEKDERERDKEMRRESERKCTEREREWAERQRKRDGGRM